MIFLSLGHKVIAIEKNKIVFHLVNDAIKRASKELEFINKLDFRCGDSFNLYQSFKDQCDIVYLDPMYPVIKKNQKKSGAIEAIKFLQKQENFIDDSEELINKFLNNDFKKIILKRPLKSKKKYSNINYQVKGSTTRFDIYL
jgi:16S rRNA (guanine1516-N2)-methyltransferase